MSILFGLLFARRFYCRTALSFSPGRTGGLLPRINAPTETAIPEIDRKWLSSMMWHCLNKQRICPYRFTCQGIP